MQQIPLAASRREGTGKGVNRKLRAQGLIPAVVYGAGREASPVAVTKRDLDKLLRQASGTTAFLALSVDGGASRTALLKDLQSDHLGKRALHVDFYEVDPEKELSLEVPVDFHGDAPGITFGGVVSIASYTVELKGRLDVLPGSLAVDLGGLELNQAIHLRDVALPAGVTAADPDLVLATCAVPVEKVETPVEETTTEAEATEEKILQMSV